MASFFSPLDAILARHLPQSPYQRTSILFCDLHNAEFLGMNGKERGSLRWHGLYVGGGNISKSSPTYDCEAYHFTNLMSEDAVHATSLWAKSMIVTSTSTLPTLLPVLSPHQLDRPNQAIFFADLILSDENVNATVRALQRDITYTALIFLGREVPNPLQSRRHHRGKIRMNCSLCQRIEEDVKIFSTTAAASGPHTNFEAAPHSA